jgi:hypothetical protein
VDNLGIKNRMERRLGRNRPTHNTTANNKKIGRPQDDFGTVHRSALSGSFNIQRRLRSLAAGFDERLTFTLACLL